MAFAVTGLKTYGVAAYQPLNRQYEQVIQLDFTAAVGDVALDLGDAAGTFWTSVGATTNKAVFFDALTRATKVSNIQCAEIQDTKTLVRSGVSVATTQYKRVTTIAGLALTQFAGEGVTAGTVLIRLVLQPGVLPVAYGI